MNHQHQPGLRFKVWLSLTVRMMAFAVALLWPAGHWRWWEAWVLIGLWVGFAVTTVVFLSRHDPALLAERMKSRFIQKEQMAWDKILMLLMLIPGLAIYIIPGFDIYRFGWSEPLPVWIEIIAMVIHLPGFVFIGWVMRENTFLSPVVKIDDERGHQVITTGPYARVRHPMYSAVIVLALAVPVALGSRFGLIPAALTAALLIARTVLEDRALHRELPGYPEYTKQTPFRLVPGIW